VNHGQSREPTRQRPHAVAVLAAHPAPGIELAVPTAVFGMPRPALHDLHRTRGWYEVRICDGDLGLDVMAAADTIVVAAGPDVPPDPEAGVHHALRRARARRARIVGIGSGAFVLAAAGVLAGRRATTHWSVCDELRRRHPEVVVDDPVLYTEDDGVFTSPGGAATLDLCLDLVRRDHGVTVAAAVARWLLAPPNRAGDQPQCTVPPVSEAGDQLSELLDWASARLDRPLTLAELARAAGVSPRTLARRFHAALGTTPLQWLLTQRIRRAQELLESTDHPIDQIAERSGFGSPGNLRQQFTRALGMSPQRYRRTFRASAGGGTGARSA
jgi:AraC family transcriptional regulator, transcriptional activator FtrA